MHKQPVIIFQSLYNAQLLKISHNYDGLHCPIAYIPLSVDEDGRPLTSYRHSQQGTARFQFHSRGGSTVIDMRDYGWFGHGRVLNHRCQLQYRFISTINCTICTSLYCTKVISSNPWVYRNIQVDAHKS